MSSAREYGGSAIVDAKSTKDQDEYETKGLLWFLNMRFGSLKLVPFAREPEPEAAHPGSFKLPEGTRGGARNGRSGAGKLMVSDHEIISSNKSRPVLLLIIHLGHSTWSF